MTPAAGARAQPSTPAARGNAPQPTVSSQGSFNVSQGLRTRCNLPSTPEQSPQFDFDDAGLRERGRSILDRVADCMTTGALKDSSITIVGHTDPRGPDEYNHDLGLLRAEFAREYLLTRGVSASRVTVQSRGELDATGTDENTWQLDRRIDIDETAPTNPSTR